MLEQQLQVRARQLRVFFADALVEVVGDLVVGDLVVAHEVRSHALPELLHARAHIMIWHQIINELVEQWVVRQQLGVEIAGCLRVRVHNIWAENFVDELYDIISQGSAETGTRTYTPLSDLNLKEHPWLERSTPLGTRRPSCTLKSSLRRQGRATSTLRGAYEPEQQSV